MRLRSKLALTIFAFGCIGLMGAHLDRAQNARRVLYGKVEARAEAMAEAMAGLLRSNLRGDRPWSEVRARALLAELPSFAYLEITDAAGKRLLLDGPKASSGGEDDASPAGREFIESSSHIRNADSHFGTVRVGLSLEGARTSVRRIFRRDLIVGAFLIGLLALGSWWMGAILGRRLEQLLEAVQGLGATGDFVITDEGGDSEIDRLARAIKTLHGRLISEEKLRRELEASKDDLMNMLVHDMKHPITVLAAVVSVLAEDRGEPLRDERRDFMLRMAKRSICRESAMIDDLLQLARLENPDLPLQKKRLRLGSFLDDCAMENSLIVEQSRRPWSLMVDDGIRDRWIYGDVAALKRVVGNLVLNAIEHSPAETRIILGARACGRDRSKAEIFLRDEGPGVPPERLAVIFQRYATFGESAKNVGLGLAYCRIAAEMHSARLELIDREEPGATFALVIPMAPEHAANEEAGKLGLGELSARVPARA